MRLPIQLLDPDAIVPTRAHSGDAGLDLYALEDTSNSQVLMDPSRRGYVLPVRTGIAVSIPYGHVGLINPRSGMALRGITVANAPGTIDHGYTGELIVLLVNITDLHTVSVSAGDRIAQLVVAPIAYATPQVVDALPGSARGTGGFGSTGGN
jgi:dUTP pyrophosphatase